MFARTLERNPSVGGIPSVGALGLAGLVALLCVVAPTSLSAQAVAGGVFDEETAEPLGNVVVRLLDEDGDEIERIETDDMGFFEVRAPGPGTYTLEIEHEGYGSFSTEPIELQEGQTVPASLEISPGAPPEGGEGGEEPTEEELREMVSSMLGGEESGDDEALEREQIDRRERSSTGYFIGEEELSEDFSGRRAYEIARRVPGLREQRCVDQTGQGYIPGCRTITISRSGAGGGGLGRGQAEYCVPLLYVNGSRVSSGDQQELGQILRSYSADELEAVEVYRGRAQLPSELATTGDACGAIVLWTKGGSG